MIKKILNAKILASVILLSAINSSFAQNSSQLGISKCVTQNNVNYCTVQPGGQLSQPSQPIKVTNNNNGSNSNSNDIVPNVVNTQALTTPMQTTQGQYSNKVPGGNVFLFCGAGRPGKANPLRPIYDSICGNNTGNQGQSQVFQPNQPISTYAPTPDISISPVAPTNSITTTRKINIKAESYNDPIPLLK